MPANPDVRSSKEICGVWPLDESQLSYIKINNL